MLGRSEHGYNDVSRQWQKKDYAHPWAGLIDRRQRLDYGPAAFSIAKNVELFGGTPAKRLGSQYLNGWGTVITEGSTDTILQVVNGSGFSTAPADGVTVYYASGVSETAVVSAKTATTVTLTAALANGAPSVGSGLTARRGVGSPGTDRIDGVFQGNFRSGLQTLLASSDGDPYVIPTPVGLGQLASIVVGLFPETTVDVGWGSATTGTLTSVEGIEVGDRIHIPVLAAPPESVAVTSVVPATRTIIVSPAFPSNPTIGQTVRLMPRSQGSDTHFTQYGNTTHMTQDPRVGTEPGVNVGDVVPKRIWEFSPGSLRQGRHGIKRPTHSGTAPTAVDGGAGTLAAGDYSYRVKFRDGTTGRESEAGSQIIMDNLAASRQVSLAGLPVSLDPTVSHKDIYRSTVIADIAVAPASQWFFVASITNATTTYADNIPDVSLGRQMREFLDTPISDDIVMVGLWPQANRLVGIDAVQNAVVFSDQPNIEDGTFKGESWPLNNSIFVSFDDGDKLIGVLAFYDSVLVFKSRSVFRILGVPPDLTIQPVSFRQDQTAVGTFNVKGIAFDQNEMLVPSEDGVYVVKRYEGDVGGFSSERMSRELDKGWARDLNVPQARRTHAVFFRGRRQYRVFIPVESNVEPTQAYVFQFDGALDGGASGWTLWDFQEGGDGGVNITASHTAEHEATGTDVTYLGTDEGDVIALDTGAAERGAFPFTFDLAPVWLPLAGKGSPARGKALDFVVSAESDTMLEVGIETDFREALRTVVAVDAEAVGFFLDISQLDVDAFGPADAEQGKGIMLRAQQALGEYHRPRFTERSATAIFRLQNWTYWFQALEQQAKRRNQRQVVVA